MLPAQCMKDGHGVTSTNDVGMVYMSTHAVGRHYTIMTIPIFHALLERHSLQPQVFDNQENSALAQLLVFLLAISPVEMS